MNVKPQDLKIILCQHPINNYPNLEESSKKCSNSTFTRIVQLRHCPAPLSPNGQEMMVEIDNLRCEECGGIMQDFPDSADVSHETSNIIT